MTEPLETPIYLLPRQAGGPANRARFNQALDRIDTLLGGLAAQVATVDLEVPRIKQHGPFVMAGGETQVELPELYQVGARRLEVERSGVRHVLGVHYQELDARTIEFFDPCQPGEIVMVTEYQIGRDAGALAPLPAGPMYTATEAPTGAIDSTDGSNGNGIFVLTRPIADGTTPRVVISGVIELAPVAHFTWVGNTVTILPGYKPIQGETLSVEYRWAFS